MELLQTTLCYLEKDGAYLMLHRVKKKNDVNHDKWVGVGGKFEPGEDALACALREVREETGLTMHAPVYRGIVDFFCDPWPAERMHLYTCTDFSGVMTDCDEGCLEWVDKAAVQDLPIWQGDKIFFKLLAACPARSFAGATRSRAITLPCGKKRACAFLCTRSFLMSQYVVIVVPTK